MKRFVAALLCAVLMSATVSCSNANGDSRTETEDNQIETENTSVDDGDTEAEDELVFQPFELENGAVYKIRNKSTRRYLNMQLAGMVDRAMVNQLGESNMLDELWRATNIDGAWFFENVMTGRYLSYRDNVCTEGTVVDVKLERDSSSEWGLLAYEDTVRIVPNGDNRADEALGLGVLTDSIAYTNRPQITVFGQPALSLWEFIRVDLPDEVPKMLPVEGQVFHSSTPQIVKFGDLYYMYVMTPGIGIKVSEDLINWSDVGKVFSGGDPSWLYNEVPSYGIWAPGIFEIEGRYFAYYCISTLNAQRSAIGVAVNETLDHTADNYKWVDMGMVINSKPGDPYNAIDPNISFDEDGNPWLSFGSYWNGIFQGQIDPETGHFIDSGELLNIARVPGSSAIEAPYIIQRDGYYYLFSALGHFMDADYGNRVGRSENLHGPYYDMRGVPMLNGGGTPVTKGLPELTRPGHAAVFMDDDGTYYFVSEYFRGDPADNSSIVLISTIVWDKDGWPITALTPNIVERLTN